MNTDSPANVSKFTKEQAAKWLGDFGQAVSGTKEELITRINKFIKYPKETTHSLAVLILYPSHLLQKHGRVMVIFSLR